MTADSEVAIAVLLPDLLGTYSDAGNATVLAQRLRWRGVPARVVPVTATDVPPTTCELHVIGGGEDTAQEAAGRWLLRHPTLATTLLERSVTLAVCAGLQLLGRSVTDRSGLARPGLGLLDLTTRPGPRRQIGEAVAQSAIPGVGALAGFHNHRGVSLLGPEVTPLAHVVRGPSNHPDTLAEGAMTPDRSRTGVRPGIVATYLHGPVLARNPALADHLLERALGAPLPDLDPALVPDLEHLRRTYLGPGGASAGPVPARRRWWIGSGAPRGAGTTAR